MSRPTIENIGYVRTKFEGFLKDHFKPSLRDEKELRETVVGVVQLEIGKAVAEAFFAESGQRPLALGTPELLLFSLVEAIPHQTDLRVAETIRINGLAFRSHPYPMPAVGDAPATEARTNLVAPYREPLQSRVKADAQLLKVDPLVHMAASEDFFLETISNSTVARPSFPEMIAEFSGTKAPPPTRRERNAMPGLNPIFEVHSGKDINTECQLDGRNLFESWFPGVDFKSVNHVLFLPTGLVIFSSDEEDPRLLPATPEYKTFFREKRRKETSSVEVEPKGKRVTKHYAAVDAYRVSLSKIIREVIAEHAGSLDFESQTPLTKYRILFKRQAGLTFSPGTLIDSEVFAQEQKTQTLLRFVEGISLALRRFFREIMVIGSAVENKDWTGAKGRVAITMEQVKLFEPPHVRNEYRQRVLEDRDFYLRKLMEQHDILTVNISDVQKLMYLEGYDRVMYQKVMESILHCLMYKRSPELEKFEKLTEKLRPSVEGNLSKSGLPSEDKAQLHWAAVRWLFINFGAVYLMEERTPGAPKKTPLSIRHFFADLLGTTDPSRALPER